MIHHGSDLRLIARVARLYHEEGLTQTEVGHRLGLTQVAVSRLLKKADESGIVRTSSGNTFSRTELEDLQKSGAVGDICFYDANGHKVRGALEGRVIGIDLESLRQVQRSVALCGGKKKLPAILGALRGKWINTLITDQYTAHRLVKAQPHCR